MEKKTTVQSYTKGEIKIIKLYEVYFFYNELLTETKTYSVIVTEALLPLLKIKK